MQRPPSIVCANRPRRAGDRGAALVVVLGFVVMLLALLMAYFSRGVLQRQISDASSNLVMEDLLAGAAVDAVVSDFRQEIAQGSLQGGYPVYTNSASGQVTRIYIPVTNKAASPFVSPASITNISGTGTNATNGLENVVKISSSASPNIFPAATNPYNNAAAAPKRVAAGDYTTNRSANGRSVSPVRWNKPLLMARNNPSDDRDVTPASSFISPEWILVNRDGSNPVSWSGDLVWSPTNPTTVVGRYAYIIYNEGGLLDASIAGYPPALTNSLTNPYVPYKGSLGFADLSQIGLTTAQINALIGWRNVASAGSVGSYPNYGFPGAVTNYGNALLTDTNGGMKAFGVGSLTDRRFTGRQQLIDFLIHSDPNNRSAALNSLQYLGTFGRDVSQPSFVPPQGTNPAAPGFQTSYPDRASYSPSQGGNKEYTNKTVNPPFPTVRVINTFARLDGTPADPGDPLVIKRFPLNRLAWLTCKGPSALNLGDPAVQQSILQMGGNPSSQSDPITHFVEQGTADNILKAFGLVWNAAGYWTYTHAGSGPILSLAQVAAQNREPDFFELLKAGVNAGSLAKASSDTTGSVLPLTTQAATDASVNDAVMQLGANIIDQFDSDGYPSVIRYNYTASLPPVGEFAGIENLPYINRVHPAVLTAVKPGFRIGTNTASEAYYRTIFSETKYWNSWYNNQKGVAPVAYDGVTVNNGMTYNDTVDAVVTNSGLGVVTLIPELWNPHDWDSNNLSRTLGIAGATPTNFRIFAVSSAGISLIGQEAQPAGGIGYPSSKLDANKTSGYPNWGFPVTGEGRTLNSNNTQMTFSITNSTVGASLFREPTVLYRPGRPYGSQLAAPPLLTRTPADLGNITKVSNSASIFSTNGGIICQMGFTNAAGPENNSPSGPPVAGRSYIGMYLGSIPLIWKPTDPGGTMPRAQYVKLSAGTGDSDASGSKAPPVDVTLYLQYNGPTGWVTYDRKTIRLGETGFVANPEAGTPQGVFASPLWNTWAGFLQPYYEADTQYFSVDPRSRRFGMQTFTGANKADGHNGVTPQKGNGNGYVPFSTNFPSGAASGYAAWINSDEGIMGSIRDGWAPGSALNGVWGNSATPLTFGAAQMFYPGNNGNNDIRPGLLSQNITNAPISGRLAGDGQQIGTNTLAPVAQYYADADGIVRRAMGGWVDAATAMRSGTTPAAWINNYAELLGLPMRRAHQWNTNANMLVKTDVLGGTNSTLPLQAESRPMILNRPFRTVAELGYTFSGTPWKNINFEMPESGDSGLLDIFCIQDTSDPSGLLAGKVDLNTRQRPVLKAIIAGAYKEEWGAKTNLISTNANALADIIASRLVARTTGITNGVTLSGTNTGPLMSVSQLVGRWVAPRNAVNASSSAPPFGPASFEGFSADLLNPAYFLNPLNKTTNDVTDDPLNPVAVTQDKTIGRRRVAPIRALSAVGQTRFWNIMIDLVVQRGKYPVTATGFDRFMVEGEGRYWVHLSIDRLTGQVIDKQIEVVKE